MAYKCDHMVMRKTLIKFVKLNGAAIYFILMVILLPIEAEAGQPIEGAFGQILGKKFSPEEGNKMFSDNNLLLFTFIPKSDSSQFKNFMVSVTPLGYQIYSIRAEADFGDLKTCSRKANDLFLTEAVEKYDVKEYGSKLLVSTNKDTYFIDQEKLDKRLKYHCKETGQLSVLYQDLNLQRQAPAEHQTFNKLFEEFEAKHYKDSIPLLLELAENGNLQAKLQMGLAYRFGLGVVLDEVKAEGYYLQAAKKGMVEAQYNLGTFYALNKRFDAAKPWLLSAAEQGVVVAEENLAQLYLQGEGNAEEAFPWLLKAAEAGRVESQYKVCLMYNAGDGVERNEVNAYQWCDIAASSGHEKAKTNREFITKRMTTQQVSMAKLLSKK